MWQKSTFTSSENYQCSVSTLVCESSKANVVFLHGWGDHSGRYLSVGEVLHKEGYNILIPDFPGHGSSEGPIARVDDFSVWVADLNCFLDSQELSRPVVFCAHSMGGTLAFHYSLNNPARVDSVIFNSAALTINPSIPLWKRVASKLLGVWLPHMKVAQLKTVEMMTSLSLEASNYNNDNNLYHGKIEAATGRTLINVNHWVKRNMDRFTLPFLVLQGENDVLVNPLGPQLLMDKSVATEKQIKLYKNNRHDLFHDISSHQVVDDIRVWLASRFEGRDLEIC